MTAIVYGITTMITIIAAVGVLISSRPILSGYLLSVTMIGLGAIFWELKSPTLGGLQILIYGGGVLVMVLFVVMLTPSGHQASPKNNAARLLFALGPLAGVLAALGYPPHPHAIRAVTLGRQLLMQDGLSLEAIGFLLFAALSSAIAIASFFFKGGKST